MSEYRTRWRFYRTPGQDAGAKPVARLEFEALGDNATAALAEAMQRYRDGRTLPNELRSLAGTGGLLELRVQLGTNPYRLIFFKDGPVSVAVLAVYKNQKKLPQQDKDRAIKRMKTWRAAARGAS